MLRVTLLAAVVLVGCERLGFEAGRLGGGGDTPCLPFVREVPDPNAGVGVWVGTGFLILGSTSGAFLVDGMGALTSVPWSQSLLGGVEHQRIAWTGTDLVFAAADSSVLRVMLDGTLVASGPVLDATAGFSMLSWTGNGLDLLLAPQVYAPGRMTFVRTDAMGQPVSTTTMMMDAEVVAPFGLGEIAGVPVAAWLLQRNGLAISVAGTLPAQLDNAPEVEVGTDPFESAYVPQTDGTSLLVVGGVVRLEQRGVVSAPSIRRRPTAHTHGSPVRDGTWRAPTPERSIAGM